MSSWYLEKADLTSPAVCSKVMLSRNLADYPFPSRITAVKQKEINETVRDTVLNSDTPFAKNLKYISVSDIPQNEFYAMSERFAVTDEFINAGGERALLLSQDEKICIMLGGEDHITIQVTEAGLDLDGVYNTAFELDSLISKKLNIAFDDSIGYLTSSPSLLGTGLKASVTVHLPAMESGKQISAFAESISKIGFQLRFVYGDRYNSAPAICEISNQITLGISEKQALDNLKVLAFQICQKEISAEKELNGEALEDTVYRAYGILKNARILSNEEMMALISRIKTGAALGIIKITDTLPYKTLIECQPYMLMRKFSDGVENSDVVRANTVRELFKEE